MFKRLVNLSNREVLLILVVVALISSGTSLLFNLTSNHANFAEWGEGWLQNFSTEMLGAGLTFVLLDIITGNRQDKERLIRELGSRINEVATHAAEELRIRGWLEDSSLRRANLRQADLRDAFLETANLQDAKLKFANLQNAHLIGANLCGSDLGGADLQGADLHGAFLEDANLVAAILKDTDLIRANLQGAMLGFANLEGANLKHANLLGVDPRCIQFDEDTKLPDGSRWKAGTDLYRFTDPAHPQFWRSDNPKSPAYRGNTSYYHQRHD